MEPIDFVGALRRSWRLLVVLAVLGAIVAVLLPSSHTTKTGKKLHYQATSYVGAPPSGGGGVVGPGVTPSQIQFYAESTAMQTAAAQLARLNEPSFVLPEYLSSNIVSSTAVTPTTAAATAVKAKKNAGDLVALTAQGKTKTAAIKLANAYAYVIGAHIQTLANQRQQAQEAAQSANSSSSDSDSPAYTGYQIMQWAVQANHVHKAASGLGSSRKVKGLIGLVLGAAVGAGIVLLRELLDKHLRTATRAESVFGYPVVVEIPAPSVKSGAAASAMVDVVNEPDSAAAEAYRMLRMSVMFEPLAVTAAPSDDFGLGQQNGFGGSLATLAPLEPIGPRQIVLIVSAGDEPSRPQAAASLAAIYAEAGQKVVVLSTGEVEVGRRGTVGAVISGPIRPEEVAARLEPSRLENVYRLSFSSFVGNSGQLVTRAPAVLEALRPLADVIIVEAPSVLAVHHAEALAHSVDVVLVVGECGETTFDGGRRAGDLLRRMGAPVLGVVLTNVRMPGKDIRQPVDRQADEGPPGTVQTADEPVLQPSLGSGTTVVDAPAAQ